MGWNLLFCLIISFVAALTALAPAPARAEAASGSVNGIVVDANSGNPMEYAIAAVLKVFFGA